MKNLIKNLRTLTALAALLALPQFASAATKTWVTLAASPATTNITAGVATNLTTTLTWRNGSGASARFAGNALLSISLSPAEPSITIALSQTNYTFPNSDTTYNPTLSFTTTALTPSNTYVVTIIGNTNPPTPVNPVVVPVTNTFTVTMATGGTFNPLKVWSPAGVNGDWSTAANWAPNGAPGSSNDVQFCDLGIVPSVGTPDNTVDSAFNIGSLTYGQTNDYHTTLIDPGLTLTVSGTNGLNVGTGTAAGDALQLTTTVQGPGAALVVSNSSAIINIDQSQPLTSGNSSTTATLDLSGLDTFNASVARVLIGEDTTTALRGACGVLNLAKTNKITMTPGSASPQIDLGANIQSGATPGLASILSLGQTNAIFADSIAVGRGKTVSPGGPIIQFNSSFTNPVAYFRGTNGASSRIGMWSIADAWGAKTSQNSASADFSLGTVNALVDQMWIGVGASQTHLNGANVPGNGTLTLGAGIIDVNTLEVGYSTADAPGNGTVNVNGGTLNVNTFLELAHGAGSSGALNISSATVNANAGVTAGGGGAAITLSTGALSVANAGATLGTPVSPLGSLSAANSTLTLAVQAGTPSASVGTLTGGGAANPVNISSVPVLSQLPAQFPVIQYTTDGGSLATFTLGSLPAASPAYAGYLSNNTANSSLDLVITSGPVVAPLVWGGQINGNWDTSTANWKTNGVSATFRQGYAVVRFDDTLVGNNSVNLTTALTNGSLTVNNSGTDYTFGGPGKLSGGTALTKTGSRMLTLAESGGDDFTGGVEVSGGTLQVGNGGTSGTLPAGEVTVDSGAALVFNRSDNLAVPGVVSGLGTLTQNGTGLLALNGSNSAFGGTITVAHGVLQPGNVAALGTPSVPVTVNNGATLDVNGQKFNNTQPITAAGPGVGGNGAIVNNSTNSPNQILRNVTLSGPTTFGGYSDWDIHASANPAQDATLSTSGTAYNLTKVGTNTVTIFGAVVDGALGDIALQAGSLSFERKTTGLGNPANIVTVFTNATLQFANPSNVWSKVVVLNAGATFRAINQAEFAGPVTLQSGVGSIVANTAGAQFILDAAVGGAGGLTKSGAGILTLTSPSTYAGPTLVSAGTLALVNSGSIDSSVNITVSAGAAIDLSALASPTLTLTAGRGLQGSGTVIGSVTMASGSTLTVGGPGTNTLGTLTVTNSLALQAGSTNLMQVSKAGGSPTSDLVVATNITYGGTLTVSGAGGALAAGDTFKLFSAGSLGGSFSRINLPFGTTWDTSRLGIDGTIKVLSVVRPQFSSVGPTNGGFQLSLSGPGGDSYHVWSTTNVAAAPVTSTWTALVTNGLFDNVTGAATFLDTSATNYPRLFYTITVP